MSILVDPAPAEADRLRGAVLRAYSGAAEHPERKHCFPLGPVFAESIGYPRELLDSLPSVSVDAFAGVSNVSLFARIPAAATVLDVGCGAGLDTLVAARRVSPEGRAIGVDFSHSMLERASQAAAVLELPVSFCQADAESLPIGDGCVDIALVNGIFNLNPARDRIFRELARVVRPGGAVYAAELILREAVPRTGPVSEAEWFA